MSHTMVHYVAEGTFRSMTETYVDVIAGNAMIQIVGNPRQIARFQW